VLLVHGTEASRVPLEAMMKAETTLRVAGIPIETLACGRVRPDFQTERH
jgi:dipeptidyl aminopeptidase/acylaminoacyl peptidase